MAKKINSEGSCFVDDFIGIVKTEIDRTHMSMSELARVAECGRPYLHRVLSGEQSPSLEWVEKISRALGIRVRFEKTS